MLVVTFVCVVVALPRGLRPASRGPQYTSGSAPPGAPVHDAFRSSPLPVTGSAPWALSALPECFREFAHSRGPAAYVRTKFPAGARRLTAGTTVRVADCSLVIGRDSARVTRGENVLRVPSPARLYVAGRRLVLERELPGARRDLRVYDVRGRYSLTAPPEAKLRPARPHSDE